MCGRFTVTNPARLRERFSRFRFPEFSELRIPRFNVAPTQLVPGVRDLAGEMVELLRWGGGRLRINVRSERIAARRGPLRRRCIVFADGFYEWRAGQPYYCTLAEHAPFAFAGLWADEPLQCAILTCPANATLADIHDRMPVIFRDDERIALWLAPEPLPPDVLPALVQPLPADALHVRAVSRRVNDVRNDDASVLAETETPGLFGS